MSSSDATAELRRSLRGFFAAQAPVRGQLADNPSTWKRLTTELGLTGLAVSADRGGSGGSFVEVAVAVEEAGRGLLRAPLLSTSVAAVALDRAGADDVLGRLLDGSATAAFVTSGMRAESGRITGSASPVVDAAGADLLVVLAGDGCYLVEAAAATVTPIEALDPTRPLAEVVLAGAPALRLGTAAPVLDLLHVALAAECIGAARRALELTVGHLKTREQFGRPLGSFQALRHRVADLTVELEAATSTASYAARAAASGDPDLSVVAPLAKATACDAFTHIAGESIQLHGGIGFTWEHDAHLYFKRAWTTALLHGESRTLRRTAFARAGC